MPTLTTAEMQRRILGFYRGPNALAVVASDVDPAVDAITACRAYADSWASANAEGGQLDTLGSILQLARGGETDDRYRRLLQMQAQTLLSSVGSTPVLEAVATIWCEADPLEYDEPVTGLGLEVVMTVPVDLEDYAPLLVFMRRAKVAGVRLNLHVADADAPMIVDYEPDDPIDGAGLIDYQPASLVTGAALLGYVHTL